jgi:hypothetical protein
VSYEKFTIFGVDRVAPEDDLHVALVFNRADRVACGVDGRISHVSSNSPIRDARGHFLPGNVANPSGRPKGSAARAAELADYIAGKTDNGRTLVDRLLEIIAKPISTVPQQRECREAIKLLHERLVGKPHQTIEAVVSDERAQVDVPMDPKKVEAAVKTLREALESKAPEILDVE